MEGSFTVYECGSNALGPCLRNSMLTSHWHLPDGQGAYCSALCLLLCPLEPSTVSMSANSPACCICQESSQDAGASVITGSSQTHHLTSGATALEAISMPDTASLSKLHAYWVHRNFEGKE